MSITKVELIEAVYEQMNIERKKAVEIIDIFFEEMKTGIENNGFLSISGLGKFTIKQKKARMGRNPKTGESMTIMPRKVISFHHSNVLKQRLNR